MGSIRMVNEQKRKVNSTLQREWHAKTSSVGYKSKTSISRTQITIQYHTLLGGACLAPWLSMSISRTMRSPAGSTRSDSHVTSGAIQAWLASQQLDHDQWLQ